MNRDGHPDLVVTYGGTYPDYLDAGIPVRFGNGDGTFRLGYDRAAPSAIGE